MKKTIIQILFLLLLSQQIFSQVGIGTTTPNGALDVTSANDGMLIPRIALTATNVATVLTPTVSEMVYNTATSATGANQVTPGFYYWNGTLWVQVIDTDNSKSFNTFSQFAQRPTGLTAADAGKKYLFTQTGNFHLWTGTAWQILNESVINVKDYGAIGDGVADDTVPIQTAIDKHTLLKIKQVHIPAGTYIISNVGLSSNLELYGDGWETIIKRKFKVKGTIPGWGNPTVSRYPQSDGVLHCGQVDSPEITSNLTIRDLQMEDDVVNVGFDELMHLMNFKNCVKVNIERVKFLGFLGDGVCFGAPNNGYPVGSTNRVEDIRIIDCYFDGVNFDNRQGISFYNIDGAFVSQCYFTNCTKEDMIGAIDIEPDQPTRDIKNVVIDNNKFINIGKVTNRKPAFVVEAPLLTDLNRIKNITFSNNYCENSGGVVLTGVDQTLLQDQITEGNYFISHNSFINTESIRFIGVKGVNFSDNVVENLKTSLIIGYTENGINNSCYNTIIKNNSFIRCASNNFTTVVWLFNGYNTSIINNTFTKCGKPSVASSSILLTGTYDNLKINYNTFELPNGLTNSTVLSSSSVVNDPKKIFYIGNVTNNIPAVNFKCNNFNKIGYANYQNAFTTNLLPDSYEVGEFTSMVNGDSGLPNFNYLGGTLKTIKTLEDINLRNFSVIQFFYQVSDDANITNQDVYFRKAKSGSNAWGPWKKITYN
jgi:predicted outer membrane repeat protein